MFWKILEGIFALNGAAIMFLYVALKIYHKIVLWANPHSPIKYDAYYSTVTIDGQVYPAEMIREFVTLPPGTLFRIVEMGHAGYKLERVNEERLLVIPSK